jgi:hypothetical protein
VREEYFQFNYLHMIMQISWKLQPVTMRLLEIFFNGSMVMVSVYFDLL